MYHYMQIDISYSRAGKAKHGVYSQINGQIIYYLRSRQENQVLIPYGCPLKITFGNYVFSH